LSEPTFWRISDAYGPVSARSALKCYRPVLLCCRDS